MTTEDDFQRALDANPDDWQTRLVFADWLDEQGDPRAEGYRALAANRLFPKVYKLRPAIWTWWAHKIGTGNLPACIGHDWWEALDVQETKGLDNAKDFRERRTAEDAAALAFQQLPPERRVELLSTEPAGAK